MIESFGEMIRRGCSGEKEEVSILIRRGPIDGTGTILVPAPSL